MTNPYNLGKENFHKFLIIVLVLAFIASPKFLILAENSQPDMESVCQKAIEEQSSDRKLLEKCERFYEQESEKIEKEISKTHKKRRTLQNEIYLLKKKIRSLNIQIQQSNMMINDLGVQIEETEKSIKQTSLKIEDSRRKLADIIQVIYQEDHKSIVEVLLSEKTLSDFFDDLASLENLNTKSQELLKNIKSLKSSLEIQTKSLDKEKANLENAVVVQMLQKRRNEKNKMNKNYFLRLTESQYQKQLKQKEAIEKNAAKIRSRIFELIGVPKAPTFGEALNIAKAAASMVNIRPSFLLAIISEESALGRNVGQCFLVNDKTGEGIRITNSRKAPRTMKPTRDVPIFLKITKKLGRDPHHTPVSCWIPLYYHRKPYGWGGAMGPAQFIPSTWNLYINKLKKILHKDGDPWNIKDSFVAAALYLADSGAKSKTRRGETLAANRYSGGYSWYARDVIYRTNCIQGFINSGSMSSDCQSEIGLK